MIQPQQDDIDLLVQIIDLRDFAHLAGHRGKPFRLVTLQGETSVLMGPGRARDITVSTFALQRLRDIGLFRAINTGPTMATFDLVDDVRDRLEEMRVALGQPSRLGEAEAARLRAEAALHDLEGKVQAAAAARTRHRGAFAQRVGWWARLAVRVALAVVYVGVVVVAGYFVSSNLPLAIVVGIIAVGAIVGVLGWLLRIDGFAAAAKVENAVVARVTRWLESFDPGD